MATSKCRLLPDLHMSDIIPNGMKPAPAKPPAASFIRSSSPESDCELSDSEEDSEEETPILPAGREEEKRGLAMVPWG